MGNVSLGSVADIERVATNVSFGPQADTSYVAATERILGGIHAGIQSTNKLVRMRPL